ncbi:MAG: phosphoenolpyruvate carboxykinase (ATP), partial [Geminicoccales bacterium]
MLKPEAQDLGLEASGSLRQDLSSVALVQRAVRAGEGTLVADGAFATTTGRHTGRSPKDRFIVKRPSTRGIDWGKVNQAIDPARADRLWAKAQTHIAGRDLFVQN